MVNWLICLGAKKAGTSALFYYLKQHPKVQPCVYKEPLFFTRNYEYKKGLDYYKSLFPNKSKDSVYFEASAQYLTGKLSPSRIKENLKDDVKFIAILRDPVERLFSQYVFDRNHHGKYYGEFNEIARQYLSLPENKKHTLPFSYMFGKSIYVRSFVKWFKYYDRDKFLILDSKDLKSNPNRECNKVFKFVGLNPFNIKDTRPIYQSKYRKEDKINIDIKMALKNYYSKFNKKLYKLIDKEFNWE